MNRIDKPANSQARQQNISYNSIKEIIKQEQRNYCAYTQTLLTSTDLAELDHFNPTLKGTSTDGYENWFIVKAKWNRKKGDQRRWRRYQPIVHPTDQDFETRIFYEGGYYKSNTDDDDAQNLIELLFLNQSELVKERIEHISRLKDMLRDFGKTAAEFKTFLQQKFPNEIQFLRAIEVELGIKF